MKSHIYKCSRILCIVLLQCTLLSCEDFVQVELPNSQLSATAVFETTATADAAMAELYANIRQNGILTGTSAGASLLLGQYTDEFTFFGSPGDPVENFFNNAVLPVDTSAALWWSTSYNQVYQANAILEGVAASSLPETDKQRLYGEALFIRALVHFYLTGLFGDIPYITSTDYRLNAGASRLPAAEVYTAAINDLEQASVSLPEAYTSPDRIKPNKAAVLALLARIHLYAGHWQESGSYASMVIADGNYTWNDGLNAEFLMSSPATIWQLAPQTPGKNTEEATTFVFDGTPPLSAISPGLMDAFEAGDLRREAWVREVSDGQAAYFHPYKYKEVENTAASMEYSVMLRLAEQYLIRSEARAQLGDLAGALEDLNRIRHRAGLPDSTASGQVALLEHIYAERRVELFSELGHRFFDLKRAGTINAALSPIKPGWEAHEALFPIPEPELLLNPNLSPQNPGY
jgi:starch-binding outer membrane protein, SusD/RagB family